MSKSQNETEKKNDESRVPDGGWGWMIVLGVALTNMFNQALISVFGLLFGQHLESMGHETNGIALISNVNNMVLCFSGLLTGPVLNRYSCRKVCFVGSCMTSFGLFMCSFATTLTEVLIFYSILGGLGLGLIYPSSFYAIKIYFSKYRGRAVGLSMAGTGIGQMLMPQLVRIFLDEYGFAWTIRIVGVLCLHGLVGSLLFQPVQWHLKPKKLPDQKQLLNNNKEKTVETKIKISNIEAEKLCEKENENNLLPAKISCDELNKKEKVEIIDTKIKIPEKELLPEISKKSWMSRISKSLQFSLLLDPSFFNLCIGVGMLQTSGVAFGMIFPFLLMEGPHLKLTRTETALCMSTLSAADIIARLTVPSITYYLGLSTRATFMWGALLLAGARSVIAIQTELNYMIAASLLCGYIRAITVINQNLTVSEYCSVKDIDQKLPAALGLVMVSKGILVISVGQLLGWLRDYSGSYTLFIYGTNVLCIFVFVSWGLEFIVQNLRASASTNKKTSTSNT